MYGASCWGRLHEDGSRVANLRVCISSILSYSLHMFVEPFGHLFFVKLPDTALEKNPPCEMRVSASSMGIDYSELEHRLL